MLLTGTKGSDLERSWGCCAHRPRLRGQAWAKSQSGKNWKRIKEMSKQINSFIFSPSTR